MQSSIDQARAELAKTPQNAAQIAEQVQPGLHRRSECRKGQPVPEVGVNADLDATVASLKPGEVSPVIQVGPTKLAVAAVTNVEASKPAGSG